MISTTISPQVMKNSIGSKGGFSLMEIMLVVAIIALLAGAAVMKMGGTVGTAKIVRTQGDIKTLSGALTLYEAISTQFPTTEQGLKALVEKPTTAPIPRGWTPQVTDPSVLIDAWGHEFHYERPAKRSTQPFDLYSAGPNEQPGDSDDIGNW